MNPQLARLHDYPFQKLARLLEGVSPPEGQSPIFWSVGEPKHPAPPLVMEAVQRSLSELSVYPSTRGLDDLRRAIAGWLSRRFNIAPDRIDPARHVLPASGTREALFSIAQAVVPANGDTTPVVILPNPFYQIYEGAALLAGAEPYYLNTVAGNGYRMDFSSVPVEILDRTRLVYVCSPGNPTGAVLGRDDYRFLLELADRHDFLVASDECYSEIYFDETAPPVGLLQVASELGRDDFHRCLVFHSLSKRSNLPGLRSGFVAGDGAVMKDYLQYRTYHGCTLSNLAQEASIVAWNDEQHVLANREQYREKFDAVLPILEPVLSVHRPEAGFYLWARVPGTDTEFTRGLYASTGVKVLPGSYLSREAHGANPGDGYVRMALVAPVAECIEAAQRVAQYANYLQ
ncbi:MAG: succinyldiaminopimelate transaminase [Acidiferrobacteraceae bacterium]